MKIYTKSGDSGKTSLLCGKRVDKYDDRIEAYGTVDELISWVGLLRDQEIDPGIARFLIGVQDRLMICASILATECDQCKARVPLMKNEYVTEVENEIDRMETELEPLRSFILTGGHPVVSWCHIARNVCRRAERRVLKLSTIYPVDDIIVRYINRLSDYLFVLSRKLGRDFDIKEIQWKPEL
jgi:cob(I)alamin adenosyltransferase